MNSVNINSLHNPQVEINLFERAAYNATRIVSLREDITAHRFATMHERNDALLEIDRRLEWYQTNYDAIVFEQAVAAFDPQSGVIDIWEDARDSGSDPLEFTEEYQKWLQHCHDNEQRAIDADDAEHAEFWNGAIAVGSGVAHD